MTLRTRILLAVAAPAIGLLCVFSAVVYGRVRADRIADVDASLVDMASGVAALIERDEGRWEVDASLGTGPLADPRGVLVAWEVIADDGTHLEGDDLASLRVGAPTTPAAGTGLSELPFEISSQTVDAVVAGRHVRLYDGAFMVLDDAGGEDPDEGGAPATAPKGVPTRILLAEDLAPVAQSLHSLLAVLIGIGAGLAAVAAALGVVLSRRIVLPLAQMAARAEAVRDPPSKPPLDLPGTGDEIDRLATTLNETFGRLYAAYARQAGFTADASHELRTPLAVIRAHAELAVRRPRSVEEYRQTLAVVIEATGQMQETLDALLLLARTEAAARADDRVDVSEIAGSVLESARAGGGGHHLGLEGDPVAVRGDARQIEVLLRNLVSNAIRHTPPTGEVVVMTTRQEGRIQITVRDTGEGIPAHALPHIFERFYRVDESRHRGCGGVGLGLAIVRAVATHHGGTVTAESERGRGTRMCVTLPAWTDPP